MWESFTFTQTRNVAKAGVKMDQDKYMAMQEENLLDAARDLRPLWTFAFQKDKSMHTSSQLICKDEWTNISVFL